MLPVEAVAALENGVAHQAVRPQLVVVPVDEEGGEPAQAVEVGRWSQLFGGVEVG